MLSRGHETQGSLLKVKVSLFLEGNIYLDMRSDLNILVRLQNSTYPGSFH